MSSRAASLILLLVLAGCSPAGPTTEPATPLPATVELDAGWTEPIAWTPVGAATTEIPLRATTNARPDALLVTHALPLDLSFRVTGRRGVSEWCEVTTQPDQVVFPFKYGCVNKLRIIVPDRVECGALPSRPTADAFAAALLALPGLDAIDLGPVEGSPLLPPALFAMPVHGRIVSIPGTARAFDKAATNPDRCQIALADGPIELRGDNDAFLILVDAGSRLALIHVAAGGSDAVSGQQARDRGYAMTGRERPADFYRSLLGDIRAISLTERQPVH